MSEEDVLSLLSLAPSSLCWCPECPWKAHNEDGRAAEPGSLHNSGATNCAFHPSALLASDTHNEHEQKQKQKKQTKINHVS